MFFLSKMRGADIIRRDTVVEIPVYFSYRFTNRDSIILHKKQHNQEKTHFCSVCLKGFYKASCLTRHMRSHTGERPYQCEFCNKSFSQSTTLKLHREKCSQASVEERGVVTHKSQIIVSNA